MSHFFCKEWREGNFLIPANREHRKELLAAMRKAFESDEARQPEHAAARKTLLARIMAVDAYDKFS